MIQGASDIEWVTAIAAAVAAAGAVLAFAVAVFQIYQERTARKEQERDLLQRERRAQVERLSAWPGVDLDEHDLDRALKPIRGAGLSSGRFPRLDPGHRSEHRERTR